MPPVRPPSQPYWMGILQQSAQTTQSAFDDINSNLERARRARFESEQYKADTLTQMRKFENEDRDYRMKERLLNFQVEQAGVDNYHKQITHDLYLRRQALDEAKARTDLTVNQFLEPLDTEIKQLEGMPGTEQRVQELKAKRQGLVDPILKQINDVPNVSTDPVEREELINRNVTKTFEIINRGLSNDKIDNGLFPDSLNNQIGEQYAREEGSSPMRDLTETDEIREFIKGTEAAQPATGEVDNRPFDFGPSVYPVEKTPVTRSYPVGGQPRAVPVGTNDPSVEFTNPLEMPKGQYGPRVDQEMIDSKLSYIDNLRNRAVENKTYTPAHEKRYSDYLDQELGKTNNPLRIAAASKIKTALIGDLDAETRSNMILSAQAILGPSETQRIADEAIIDKQRLGKEAAFEKMNQELDLFRKKEEIKKEMEGGVDEISKTRKELDDIRSLLADPESSPNQLSPDTITALRTNEAKLTSQLNDLIAQKYAEPQVATPEEKEVNPLALQLADRERERVEESFKQDVSTAMSAPEGRRVTDTIKTVALPRLGLKQEDFKYIEGYIRKLPDDASRSDMTIAIKKGISDKFSEEWDGKDSSKKEAFTKSKVVKDYINKNNLGLSYSAEGIATLSATDKRMTPKQAFIEMKLAKMRSPEGIEGFESAVVQVFSSIEKAKREEEERDINDMLIGN
jgi:hypothetical protein